jgi:hypothetical protein
MSRLTQIISLLYRRTEGERAQLERQLLEQRKRTWSTALRAEAQRHGCNKVARSPSGADLAELRRMSREDADSIIRTWNADVERQVEKLYADNPRGNRNYYARGMEAWAAQREAFKGRQIALVTETTAAEFARGRFREANYTGRERFQLTGPPPTCRECATLFAAGAVDNAFIRRHPTPVHIGCPHTWTAVRLPKINCSEMWLG